MSFVGWALSGCVSESTPEMRFLDSQALAQPTLNITVADPDNFSFAMVGDFHIGDANTERLELILNWAATEGDSFAIILGDMVDKGRREDYLACKQA